MKGWVLFATVLLLTACAQKEQPLPPMPPTPPPQIIEDANPVPDGASVLGPGNKTSALEQVTCDKATRSVTFTFKNNDPARSWQLNQEVAWDAPKDLVAVDVLINNYEVNGRNRYINNGETFFGPNWPFSENCGGVKVLAPGQQVTCTVTPVPLKTPTALSAGTNEIFIKTFTTNQIIQFTCN